MPPVNAISVTPLVGEFPDVECGKLFVIPFTVRNISNRICRIRTLPPKSKCFRLLSTQQSIAPGMKQTIEVEFTSNTPMEVHDELTIRSDEGDVVIPLRAWFPTPNIVFAPQVDFGDVSINHPIDSKKLKLKNIGRKDGVFKFVSDTGNVSGISITPNQGIVPAGKDIDVAVHLFPTEVGVVRSAFSLHTEGQSTQRVLTVSAHVDEAKVLVVHPKTLQALTQFNFGKLYYGQKREVQVCVQNTGQSSVSFSVSPPETDAEDVVAAPFPIQVYPREGRIGRHGSTLLTFTFAPQMLPQKNGWEHAAIDEKGQTRSWDFRFEIDVLETEQKLEVQLAGTAVPTMVRVSEKLCRFGVCPANSHRDVVVSLQNLNGDLPVLFELNRVAHYASQPSRGVIAAGQTSDVRLTFQPKQLGSFEGQFVFSLNGGIKRIPVMVTGQSSTIDPKPPRVSGAAAVAEDYHKPIKPPQLTGPAAPVGGRGVAPGMGDALDVLLHPEHEQKLMHNRLYNTYLTNSRAIREVNQYSTARPSDNPDDMGMVPGEGLVPPEPTVSKRVDRLPWSGADGQGMPMQLDHPAAHKVKIDENKLVKKKFRKDPANLNEMRECKVVLSPKDIQSIFIPVKLIDFQRVSVFSVNKKPFFVHNSLKTHIHVSIAFSREELSQSSPTSQVVPPGQTAGFDVTFRSEVAQTFQQAIYFTINDAHKLKFVVFAEAAPVELNLSQDDLSFRFPDFGHDASVSHQLTLTNPGNSDAAFTWSLPSGDAAFSFHPPNGTVPPHGSLPITCSYQPPMGVNDSKVEAELRVVGGTEPKRLALSGSVSPASCTWSLKDSKVDFKRVPVGGVRTQAVSIKNHSANSTVYAFDTSLLPPGVTLSHTRGRVAANSSEEIIVTLKTTVPQNVRCNLNCHIRGMKQLLKSQIVAEAKVPELFVAEPVEQADEDDVAMDFGGVYVGSNEYRRMVVQNHDDVVADVLIDLLEFPQFTLCDQDRRVIQEVVDEEDSFLQPPGNGALHIVRHEDAPEDGEIGNLYRVTINPHEAMTFYVVFTPTEVSNEDSFRLPISLAGCSLATDALRPITIAASGKRPRLVILPTQADFGARVVVRDGTSKVPNRILVKISNETENTLSWDLEGHPDSSDAFRVEPTTGKLQPGQGSQLQVTFIPTEIRSYAARYTMYLDGNKESKYMDISAKGFGANPGLLFDRKEVIMPPVPLDTLCVSTFYVGNDGYESLELKYRVAGDGKLPLQLKFPEGNLITSTTSMIPVEVHFMSKKPIAFTVNIDLYDDVDGGLFAIPVTCTADSSLLTTHTYLRYNKHHQAMIVDNDRKPVLYKDHRKDHPRGEPTTDDDVMGSYQMLDAVMQGSNPKRQIERIKQWLNSNVLPDPVEDLIGSLQLNQGRMIVETIEMLFGKVPQIPKPQQVRDGPLGAMDAYDNILLFLKQYGACVSEVRAEYMLRYDDYVKVVPNQEAHLSTRSTARGRSRSHRVSERRFGIRSNHCWVTILTQIIRVFFFSRISWKTLRGLPATPVSTAFSAAEKWGNATDPSCTGSNLYSVAESVLLKWLSMHMSFHFPNKGKDVATKAGKPFDMSTDWARLTNFEGDLRDCRAFAACVMSYIPSSVPRLDPQRDYGMVAVPTSEDDLERNATLLLDTLQEYGLDPHIIPHELMEGSAMDNALFAAFLFNSLPQFLPKTTITFKGTLLETCTKHIELTNPTKWPIDYSVSVDGSEEFKLSETKIHLEPKGSTSVAVSITPRFAKKHEALCMFLSSRGSATMVFHLQTDVDAESCLKTFDNLDCTLYDTLNYDLMVENPFPTNAQFSVSVVQEHVREGKTYPEEESLMHFPDAFWCGSDSLTIKKSDKAKLTLQFLPCVRGTYRGRVIFRDDRVGEFAYRFIANGSAPRAFETISLQTEAAVAVSHEVHLPLKHSALERALGQRLERLKGFKAGGTRGQHAKDADSEGKEVLYKVEFLNDKFVGPNPFFNGPKSFFLAKPGSNTDKKGRSANVVGQSFNVNFTPKAPGVYNGLLLLTSQYDVRLIAIEAKSRSPGVKGDLEFNCPARQQIVQDIPITNSSENEWVISAALSGESFNGPREIRVPAGKTKSYTLNFHPSWVCDVSGLLILRNNETQEKYTYALRGKADEPLAENTIPIDCKARESRKITVSVPNITFDDVMYNIVTDLPFISGDTTLFVPKMETGKYTLHINPQLNGKVTGSVSFVAPNKQYVWYVVQAVVARPPPEATITVQAEVRKGAVAEITIRNPSTLQRDFLVRRKGDGLYGDEILAIDAGGSAVYQLAYAPTVSGTSEGTVSFSSDDIGEFWYKLQMTATDAAPTLLSFQCEIGKVTTQEVVIQNPLDVECLMTVASTNEVNYTVSPSTCLLRPGGSLVATIGYTPSAIQTTQDSTISFSHPKAGTWVYKCSGSGFPPTTMDPVKCVGQVNTASSVSATFRNPFPVPRKFNVTLINDGGVFSVLQRKSLVQLAPFQHHQVPVSYFPTEIGEHHCILAVDAADQTEGAPLRWEFPLRGVAECYSTSGATKFVCKARRELRTIIPFPLAQLVGRASQEMLVPEITIDSNATYHKAASNSITVRLVDRRDDDDESTSAEASEKMVYAEFVFSPLRPFTVSAELCLVRRGGGMWRFPVSLEAQAPEVDDVIELEAAVNVVASASFQLYNVLPQPRPYTAYFTPDSPQEFTVAPPRGTLPAMPRSTQAGAQGLSLTVNFASIQYGKTLVGVLIVDTEDMQWRYEVRGSLPKYKPPTNVQGKVVAGLSKAPASADAAKKRAARK